MVGSSRDHFKRFLLRLRDTHLFSFCHRGYSRCFFYSWSRTIERSQLCGWGWCTSLRSSRTQSKCGVTDGWKACSCQRSAEPKGYRLQGIGLLYLCLIPASVIYYLYPTTLTAHGEKRFMLPSATRLVEPVPLQFCVVPTRYRICRS